MTITGWILMLVSTTSVTALTVYCLVKVMSLPPVEVEDMHAPLDIDTGDTKRGN